MTAQIVFDVAGTPKPQGSKKAWVHPKTKRAVMTESAGAPLKDWRAQVGHEAGLAMVGGGVLDEPVTVTVVFRLAKPKSAAKWRWLPWSQPDIDKLTRAVLDAMTGVVFRDDSLVVELVARKVYALGVPTGASICVEGHGLSERELGEHPSLAVAVFAEEGLAGGLVRSCRVCGCTDERACLGGCSWAGPDLCSSCVETAA